MDKLLNFLALLDEKKIFYVLGHIREETVLVTVSVPGEIWEVEFFSNGEVEIERFKSGGKILGEEFLNILFEMGS